MLDLASRPSPPPAPLEGAGPVIAGPRTWTAAGLLVAAAAVGLLSLVPDYYASSRLDRADEIVPVVMVALGWLACGIAVADRHAGRVALGGAAGAGIAVADLGQRLADPGLSSGAGSGPGLWLQVAAWVAGAAGAGLALFTAARAGSVGRPGRPGGAPAGDHAFALFAVAAGLLVAGAFVPSWDRYVITTAAAPNLVVSRSLGYAFDASNPALMMAGNAVTVAAFALVPIAAMLWRPVRIGAALLLGEAVVIASQVVSAAVQVMETPDPRQVLSPDEIARFRPTVSLHLTGWYDAELAALLVLLIVAAARLHHLGAHPAAAAGDLGALEGGPPGAAEGGAPHPHETPPAWGHVPPPDWADTEQRGGGA